MRRLLPLLVVVLGACTARGPSDPEARPDRDAAVIGTLDAAPSADVGVDFDLDPPPDGAAPAPVDARAPPPDAAPSPDAALDIDAEPCAPFAAPPPPDDGLPAVRLVAELPVGAPLAGDAAAALDVDGDPAATLERLAVRGGRVELYGADGRPWWRTAVIGARRLVGVDDLDGDGRREVVVAGTRAVHVLDGLTGEARWQTPDAPFGDDRALTSIVQARLVDLDGDELVDLYLTDGGCGDEGSGRGAVFGFAAAFGERVGLVDGPRLNGRCTRWHTVVPDADPWVMVTDGAGLNGFDPQTGARRWCGTIEAPPNGPLPHHPVELGDTRMWFVALPDAVVVAGIDADGPCPGGDGTIEAQARAPGAIAVDASAVVELPGGPRLIASIFDAEADRWQLVSIDVDGRSDVLLDGARLLGAIGTDALVAVGDGARPARYGEVARFDLTTTPPTALWPLPVPRARPIRRAPDFTATAEWAAISTIGDDVLLVREGLLDGRATGRAVRLERIDRQGLRVAERALDGEPGVVSVVEPDHLLLAEPGGALALLGGDLEPAAPRVRAPTGTPAATPAFDGRAVQAAVSSGGLVTLLDPGRPATAPRWAVAIGSPSRGGSSVRAMARDGLADALLVRDALAGDAAWSALDAADGALLWRHRLDPALFRPVGEAVPVAGPNGRAEVVVRADLVLDPASWPDQDDDCGEELGDVDAAAPADACPGFVVKPRVVRGLDAATGACRWRHVLRPAFPCGGPSNQALSATDADGDGWPEVYLTETTAVRRFDARSGALLTTIDLGVHPTGAIRGGGWLVGGPGGLVRAGGNGPLEVFDPDLSARWSAESPDGLRLQAWIRRPAHLQGDRVWSTPGAGWPLTAWSMPTGERLARIGITDAEVVVDAPPGPDYRDVQHVRPVADADGQGGDGLLVTAGDGVLRALDADGRLLWQRTHDAAVGAPQVVGDAPDRAIWLPASDGRLLIHGPPGPAAPPAVWDLPCPPPHSCSAADDIDLTEATERLCAAWVPVAGADGYAVRALGPNGAVVADVGVVEGNRARVDGLALVPGVRYAVDVRTVLGGVASTARASDGVTVVNDAPPDVALVAAPSPVAWGASVTAGLVASDDDLLAGWRVDIWRGDGPVRRLGGGALAHRDFETRLRWNLEDPDKRLVEPGRYRLVATVVDRAGNLARAEAPVDVCGEVCP